MNQVRAMLMPLKLLIILIFALWTSIYAESTEENLSTSWTTNEGQAVNCTIHEDSQLSSTFLTCQFPFDISSKKIGFHVKAFHKPGEQGDPDLVAGCMWQNDPQCLLKKDYFLHEGHKVKTQAVFKIPIEEAKSRLYYCELALKAHSSNPCSLTIHVSDKNNNTVDIIVGIGSSVCVLLAVTFIVMFVWKQVNKRASKDGDDRQRLNSAAVVSVPLAVNEQQNVNHWIEKQRKFLFECENLEDDSSEFILDQFMKRTMEITCEIEIWKKHIRKVKQKEKMDQPALQLLNELSVEADFALTLLENMQEAIIRRNIYSKLTTTNQGNTQSNVTVEKFVSEANILADMLWAEGNKVHTADANLKLIKSVKNVLCECLHRENCLKQRQHIEKSESVLELESKLHALELIRTTFLDLKVMFIENLRLSVERAVNRWGRCTKMSEDEYLDCRLPNLTVASFIIPEHPSDYEHVNTNFPGSRHLSTYRINDLDIVHKTIHDCLVQIKENIAAREVTVMLTQTSFSLYCKPFSGLTSMAVAESIEAQDKVTDSEQIFVQKKKYTDVIVISKLRGVLGAVIQTVHISDSNLAKEKLRESVSYLEKAANIMKEVVKTVSEMDNITVRTTLVLPNITRAQLYGCTMVQKAIQEVPCLCKDEMTSIDSLNNWWDTCWADEHPEGFDNKVYGELVAKFAIPALGVEKYLTALQQVDLQAINTAGKIEVNHEAAILSALPQNFAQLLDFDNFDDTQDDVKLLFGPPCTEKSNLLKVRAMQWTNLNADRIFILQTSSEARAASALLQTQLQQMLRAKQHASDAKKRNTTCFFTLVDLSGLWKLKESEDADEGGAVLTKEGKKMLFSSLGLLLRRQSENVIHILADEANSHVVVALYDWLKEKGVQKVRLWAAGMDTAPVPVPASLSHAVVQLKPEPAPRETNDKGDVADE